MSFLQRVEALGPKYVRMNPGESLKEVQKKNSEISHKFNEEFTAKNARLYEKAKYLYHRTQNLASALSIINSGTVKTSLSMKTSQWRNWVSLTI